LWGERDRLVPLAHGQAYATHIPRAALQVVPGAGHSPILEQPAETLPLVAEFLETGALPPSPAIAPPTSREPPPARPHRSPVATVQLTPRGSGHSTPSRRQRAITAA